ncbi:SAVED domain-containing protein [Leptolyngbya cf. ectocarpi LEGE 11479]|uniref:SAVED domain-containing protein n=1 Tax=Leptolyngbya cf. ectocarpi LEGE 11479 TaxID=1828722 RepID=A0A928ZU69_LEPEC|nr:TIR domain-containing protein [Leptolyngbya ectocarpi]MBE9067532.1 SAVED domain-containing protein [Leptolyngbya cf. ectocarpi LEGE 11479]
MSDTNVCPKDFFISYTGNDRNWAEWIAWVLEEAGYTTVIQAWDFRPGGNFILDMQEAAKEAIRTIAVLSSSSLDKPFTNAEWAAALAQDPTSQVRKLIPVRIEDCTPQGLLAPIVYVDIFNCSEAEAQQRILAGMQDERMKPAQRPQFPGTVTEREVPNPVPFPGESSDFNLWLYAWEEPPAEGNPAALLDWTPHYERDTRQIPDQDTWNTILLPGLKQVKNQLKQSSDNPYIHLKVRASLTAILALGYTFPEVGGYRFKVEQFTGNQTFLWASDEPPSDAKFTLEEKGKKGDHLLMVFSITGSAKGDVVELIQESPGLFTSVVYAEPEQGVSRQTIQSAADATALAEVARDVIQRSVKKYRPKTTHLILFAPQAFCLFLGQKLNALGTIAAYERTGEGKYTIGITLKTG